MPNWTQSEVNAHNARVLGKANLIPESAVEPGKERELHEQILAECKRRGWIALHGSMAHRSRRTAGEFDFVVIASCGRTFLIECKTRTGKLTPEQNGLRMWAERLGHRPRVVRSFEEFLEVPK